jgi:dipeptidyl aminopeptidase/acylaminoacyl peptidase
MFFRHLFSSSLLILLVLSIGASAAETARDRSVMGKGKYVPDIATFLQIGNNSPAGMSWDGKDVYFTSSMSGVNQVYRITEDSWPYQLTTFEEGIDGFNLCWDGSLAIVSADIGGSEQSQFYLMDTKSGRVVQLTDNPEAQFGSATWARDDNSIYYRSNEENGTDFFIYQMDIATKVSRKIFDGAKGYNAIADLSEDGKHMLIVNYTSNVNNDFYHLDLETGKFKQQNKDKGDVVYGSLALMPDNKTIYLTCNDNKDGISRPAKMTLGSPKVEYINDGWLDPKWECDGYGFTRDFKIQFAVTNEDGYSKLHLRDFTTKEVLPTPPMEGMYGLGGSDQDGNFLLSLSSATRAPDVWKWNPRTGYWAQLTQSIYAGIDREMFREPKLIRFKSFDGLEISAFLYLPPEYKAGEKIPFIVDAHGGPEAQFQPDFIRNFQYLMLNGYGVLAVNPRGSSGYGRDFLNLDNYKNRKNSLRDYKASVDYLINSGYTQQGMIGIRGGSYGGYVALGMITEYPELFSAAVDVVGIANFKTFLENTADYRRALRESEYGPLSDPEFLDSISPIHKADKIRTPLLVVHGENDPRVPVDEARQILAAVAKNGIPVDSLIFADEGHGSSKRENVVIEYRKQVEFFDRFLKADAIKEMKE